MGKLTAEAFADWLHPSDVVNHFYQQGMGDGEAKARTLAMLEDGLLQAAAEQFIAGGKDHGLALIPSELWALAGRTKVWVSGRFRVTISNAAGKKLVFSAYDVRIDRDIRAAPTPPDAVEVSSTTPPIEGPPLPDALLAQWGSAFSAANPDATHAVAQRAVKASFPGHFVSRERLRRIMPPRRPGRPLKDNG